MKIMKLTTVLKTTILAIAIIFSFQSVSFATYHYTITTTSSVTNKTYENFEEIYTTGAPGGGGVFDITNKGRLEIKSSIFNSNSVSGEGASGRHGGAIYNAGELKIYSSAFSSNTAQNNGGAIYLKSGTTTITSSSFKENTVPSSGGAIYNNGGLLTISSSTFSENTAKSGGAIYNYKKSTTTINSSAFNKNSGGAAISNEEDGILTISSSTFSENTGRAIYNKGTVTISSSTFSENTNSYSGGAIGNSGILKIYSSVFSTNTAQDDNGGALCNERTYGKIVTISSSIFSGNTAKFGGAIYNDSNKIVISISSSIFSENTAKSGGAIYNSYSSNVTINSSVFNKNLATNLLGGAIYNYGGIVTISSSVFSANTVQDDNGGAIDDKGGAIYNGCATGNIGILTIYSSAFSGNTAKFGGAIYNNGGLLTISDNTSFFDNMATSKGGAIYNNGGTIDLIANAGNIEFTGNIANGISNAIYDNSGTINLWASENANIIFNDRITSENKSSILNINSSTTTLIANGKVILNEDMSGYKGTINLYDGEIELQSKTNNNSNINTNKFFSGNINLSSGTLNILNNSIDNITITNLTATVNANLKFDADLSNNTSDNFTVTNSATGQLNLTAINILGMNENNGQITLFKNEKSPTLNILTTANYDGYEYTFTNSDIAGVLNYKISGYKTIKESINAWDPLIRSYSLATDELVTENLGNLGGIQLTIFGNKKNIVGNNTNGIFIASDKILNIENINNCSGFDNTYGAIKNEGILNISGTNFIGNQQDIINNGKLILLDTASSFEKGIVGVGTTTINGVNINLVNAVIEQNKIEIMDNGSLTTKAQNIIGNIENNSNLTFTEGENNNYIYGSGTTVIDGLVINNSTIANTVIINPQKQLETNATNINGEIENNGILNFIGGINNNSITGNGELIINNELINNSEIIQDTVKINGIFKLGDNGTFYNATNSILYDGVEIDLQNNKIQQHNLGNLTVNSGRVNLCLDADLLNMNIDTISADENSLINGKIKIKAINITNDALESETKILFTDSIVLKDKIETVNTAVSGLYKYYVTYDKETGLFNFKLPILNPMILESQVANISGLITQTTVLNQAFESVNNIRQNRIQSSGSQASNLYASTADVVFETQNRIESGLWIRPFALQHDMHLNKNKSELYIDNKLTGTLAGIDLATGENGLLSFYLGYAGSEQNYENIKVSQTGYVVGATGMLVKDKWYAGLTANMIFNKAESEGDYGTDNFDMNVYSIGAKTGYNFYLSEKFILEPNLILMYGNVSNQEYETTQGAKIGEIGTTNILVEPQIKLKLNLANGWQTYGLLGYSVNVGEESELYVDDVFVDSRGIRGYGEYGLGVNKIFKNSAWSAYLEAVCRGGDIEGLSGNLGIKYSFLNKKEKENIKSIKDAKKKEKEEQLKLEALKKEEKARLEAEKKERIAEQQRLEKEEKARLEAEERERIAEQQRLEQEEREKQEKINNMTWDEYKK